jgi:hypothetical protein
MTRHIHPYHSLESKLVLQLQILYRKFNSPLRLSKQNATLHTSIRQLVVWIRSFVVFSAFVNSSHYGTLKCTAASSATNFRS